MAKFKAVPVEQRGRMKELGYTDADYLFFCPGCKCDHGVWTTERNRLQAIWSFNGNLDKPTVSPSILVRWTKTTGTVEDKVCHSFINDGKIQYLSDCTHELAGQTIELPEYED